MGTDNAALYEWWKNSYCELEFFHNTTEANAVDLIENGIIPGRRPPIIVAALDLLREIQSIPQSERFADVLQVSYLVKNMSTDRGLNVSISDAHAGISIPVNVTYVLPLAQEVMRHLEAMCSSGGNYGIYLATDRSTVLHFNEELYSQFDLPVLAEHLRRIRMLVNTIEQLTENSGPGKIRIKAVGMLASLPLRLRESFEDFPSFKRLFYSGLFREGTIPDDNEIRAAIIGVLNRLPANEIEVISSVDKKFIHLG